MGAVLNVLMDHGRDVLDDVVLTQQQILDRLFTGKHAAVWGWSISSLRRTIRRAEADGWLSIEDRPVPGRGIQINCYRFHVPAAHRATWQTILDNAENARSRAVKAPRAQSGREGSGGADKALQDYLQDDYGTGRSAVEVARARRRVAANVHGGLDDAEIVADLQDTYPSAGPELAAGLDELARLRAGP